MWIARAVNPFGGVSARKILLLATAVLVAALSFSTFLSSPAYAADAEWKGTALVYNGKQYSRATIEPPPQGIPENAPIYVFTDRDNNKVHILYFAPNTDPYLSPGATYVTYDYTPPDNLSNPSTGQSVSVDTASAETANTTSCDSTFTGGIGWIICPVTNFLAKAMDWLYGILSDFLFVRPVQTTQESALYRAWSYMRNLANVAFAIGFLVIIYSQLTSLGLSNYGIKKLLPRLIITAVLVNISYWICAIAIDISNILGYAIQDMFIMMRNNLVGAEGNTWDVMNWESITGFILSGGTAAIAAGIGIHALIGGTVGGALYMLAPILVGVLLAVLVALLILAARQAIITVLVILSPLAFVAYLLPNTEKYFDRWRTLGMTMLIMFPMFSIIFGGSQLAGSVIIQNADSINVLILGMAVQVAPVVITPLLIRFSGSLLGKIAGIVNNPNRGLIDRTRKWANERSDQHKNRVLSGNRQDLLARGAKRIDTNRRKREGWNKANQALADANWENTDAAHTIHEASSRAALLKDVGENAAQARFEAQKHTNAELQNLDIRARAEKLQLDLSKARVDANWEELKAGHENHLVDPQGLSSAALASFVRARSDTVRDVRQHTLDSALEARRSTAAQGIQTRQLSEALQGSVDLQRYAGGIDPDGAQRALAYALKQQHSVRREAVDNANSIIDHSNLTDSSIVDLALGHAQGNIMATDDVREAAAIKIASGGNIAELNRMLESIDLSPSSNENIRISLTEAMKKNGMRPKYIGFGLMSKMNQGMDFGTSGLDEAIRATIEEGKLSAEVIVAQDKDALARVQEAIARTKSQYSAAALNRLASEINEAYTNDILKARVGERKTPLDGILNELGRP